MSEKERRRGRVTIPTDVDVVPETLEILERWGADAIRDCDGTDYPEALKGVEAKVYSTYYTTRKDNAWAKANPDEVQQCYIMTPFTPRRRAAEHPADEGHQRGSFEPNTRDDIKRWWRGGEPYGRECGGHAGVELRRGKRERGDTSCAGVPRLHGELPGLPHLGPCAHVQRGDQRLEGLRAPDNLRRAAAEDAEVHDGAPAQVYREHPYVDVIRYTTFFHQFTLMFDELRREKYVDWYGYSASVSPYILEQFEREAGYKFRPEYIIDQGYYNNQYRVPAGSSRTSRRSSGGRWRRWRRRWWTSPTSWGRKR